MNQVLQKKLRLQANQRVAFINLPPGMCRFIGQLPDGASVESAPASDLDLVLLFVQNSTEMANTHPSLCHPLRAKVYCGSLTLNAVQEWKVI